VDAIASLPERVGALNQDGVDAALDMVVSRGLTGNLVQALGSDPRLTIRRLFILTFHERERLYTMTNNELNNFIGPVVTRLQAPNPERFRLILGYGTTPGFTSIIAIVIHEL
jgi:hypothetical protein